MMWSFGTAGDAPSAISASQKREIPARGVRGRLESSRYWSEGPRLSTSERRRPFALGLHPLPSLGFRRPALALPEGPFRPAKGLPPFTRRCEHARLHCRHRADYVFSL